MCPQTFLWTIFQKQIAKKTVHSVVNRLPRVTGMLFLDSRAAVEFFKGNFFRM